MRAFRMHPDSDEPALVRLGRPDPGPGELRLAVAACGLNHADLLMIAGRYQQTPPRPFTLGMEVCGTVEALGSGVSFPPVGTRVAAHVGHGGLADAVLARADRCVPVPSALDETVAAAVPVAYGTGHFALAGPGALSRGERLLVLGAGSSVGLAAVEIGHALGAEVVAVARSEAARTAASTAGAHHLVDPGEGDLRATLRGTGRADVVFDPVGGAAFDAAFAATRPGARILLIGFASGTLPQIPANIALVKNLAITGINWPGALDLWPARTIESLAFVLEQAAQGRYRPRIRARYPLERAGEALRDLRSGREPGKIVVETFAGA